MIENEKVLERKLCKAIKDMGGRAYKFVSPNQRGVPDRLCILPKEISFFVELKTTGKKPTKLQVLCMNELENMGQICHVVDSSESLKALLDRQQLLIKEKFPEIKIGEEIEKDGIRVMVVPDLDGTCEGCAFGDIHECKMDESDREKVFGNCSKWRRKDRTNIKFKEIEK